MFRTPHSWNNQASVQDGSSTNAYDSLLSLQKSNNGIEEREEPLESYSIKAKKFKEIQYLRQINAQSNTLFEAKQPQTPFAGQVYYNEIAIGDDEPVKPKNLDFSEDIKANYNFSRSSARSERDRFSIQDMQNTSWRLVSGTKQNTDGIPSQRDTILMPEFFEEGPNNQTKTKANFQHPYFTGSNVLEYNKMNSLRDSNQKSKEVAESHIIIVSDDKQSKNRRKMLLPKPPIVEAKKRPQSKDANRPVYSQIGTDESRPSLTNLSTNKRMIIKAKKNQVPYLGSGSGSPNNGRKDTNEHNTTGDRGLSPMMQSPANFQLPKDNLSPSNIDLRGQQSSLSWGEAKTNIGGIKNGNNPAGSIKALNRVIQPFNRNIEDKDIVQANKSDKNKALVSFEKPLNLQTIGSSQKGRNENVNLNDNKDVSQKQKNIRGNLQESALDNVKNSDLTKQLKPQAQTKSEKKPEPKTPPKVALAKVNNNMKVEQLIRGKRTYNHKTNMIEYLKRRGLPENTKIFCFNSRDEYIRRALKKFGWVENPHLSTFLFDLKWTYTDIESDYANLMEGQYYNHFQNNKEITMKSGLIENVRSCVEHGSDFWVFFPRAYDLGHINQMKEFQEDFERTSLVNLLKKHWQYIKIKSDPQILKRVREKFKKKQEKRLKEGVIDIFKKKKLRKNVNYGEEITRKDFIIYISLLEAALNCARTLVRQCKNIVEAENFVALSQLNERAKSALLAYSNFNPPYEDIPLATRKSLGGGEEQWETPNELLIYKLYKFKKLMKTFSPQYSIDGTQNIWIIKASSNSRGSGIFLTDKLEEALDSGMKNQARIIQKYVETPLVINDFPFKPLKNKKFDIRQWVLVTSMNPLIIYMFSSCYLRICSQDFDLKNIKNNYSHLTNFSLNKGNF